MLSRVQLFVVAHQALLSVGFSRQKYWSGLPLPPPGDLPNPGIEPRSPALQGDSLKSEPPGKQLYARISLQHRKDGYGDTLFLGLEGTSVKFLGENQQPRAPLVRMRFSKVPTVAHETPVTALSFSTFTCPNTPGRASLVAQWERIHLPMQEMQRHGFDPWVGKISWRRARQPTPVCLPGESPGQRGLAGLQPVGWQVSDTT